MASSIEKSKKKTILINLWNGVGHVNGVLGAVSSLVKRGHRVVFIVEKSYKDRLTSHGVEEIIYELDEKNIDEKPAYKWANLFEKYQIFGKKCSETQRIKNFASWITSDETIDDLKIVDKVTEKAIKDLNPDLLILEELYLLPSIYKSGKPWIKCLTANPSFFVRDFDLPPWGTSFPSNTDPSEWKKFKKLLDEILDPLGIKEMKKIDSNYPEDPEVINKNLRLVTYALPLEIDYSQLKREDKLFNLEVNSFPDLNKPKNFDLEKLTGKEFIESDLNGKFSGKLVYLSMGSMVSFNISLMKKLISALGKTKHKYIVSKGLRHEEYELASNMWGDGFIPQLDLLPLVDLVITHGGHNTVTETFFFGKPLVVLPAFADQFNNGQRLQETGFGICLDSYNFTDDELISAVDKLIYDNELKERLKAASDRLKNSDAHDRFADLVEEMLA